ncbi:MAG: hypothetical protein K0R63_23 [Rickettsiales bacterium]|jgi:hypothetical protein|nr:hypothetical protein [Rickettsiales bacterium]
MTEDNFDKILQKRPFMIHSEDLAARIIIAARTIEQKQSIGKLIIRLFYELHLPRPSYVFACTLLFSMMIGFGVDMIGSTYTDTEYAIHDFLYVDEDVL